MMARESGTSFVLPAVVALQLLHCGLGSRVPVSAGLAREVPGTDEGGLDLVARSSSMVRWLCGLALEARLLILCEVGPRRACVRATCGAG